MTTADIANHYDKRAESYDEHTPFHGNLARLYTRLAAPKTGESLLDLACGTGLVTFSLLPDLLSKDRLLDGQKVIGVDISPGMLDVGRSKVADKSAAQVRFVESSIEDLHNVKELEEMEGQFDIITICSALILLPSRKLESIVKGWAKYLKPGGRMITDIPTTRSMLGLYTLSKIAEAFSINIMGARHWITDVSSLSRLMESAGLETTIHTVEDEDWLRTIPARTKPLPPNMQEGVWSIDDGGAVFEKSSKGTDFDKLDDGCRRKAKEAFEDLWGNYGDADGKVKEVGGLWIGVGVKR